MRRPVLLVYILAAMIAVSCNKPDKEPVSTEASDFMVWGFDSTSYIESGVPDFGASVSLPIMIRHISGPRETVTLSTADVPAGMKIYYTDSAGAVITSTIMNSWFGFSCDIDSNVKVGNYYPKVVATSKSGIAREDSIIVRILP